MPCVPAGSVDVLKAAVPSLTATVPTTPETLRNATVPLAVRGLTVAVNVTVWPAVDGSGEEVKPVVVAI